MKKTNTTKKIQPIIILLLLAVILYSCRKPNAEIDRQIEVFFISMSQIVNIVVFGTMALIFSIIGSTKPTNGMRIAGAILTGIFGLFALLGFGGVMDKHATNPMVFMIFAIEAAILGIAIYFSVKQRVVKGTIQQTNNTAPTLDEIINEDDEIV